MQNLRTGNKALQQQQKVQKNKNETHEIFFYIISAQISAFRLYINIQAKVQKIDKNSVVDKKELFTCGNHYETNRCYQ